MTATFDRIAAAELLRDMEREAQRLEQRGDHDGAAQQREEIADYERTVPGLRRSKRQCVDLSYRVRDVHRLQALWRGTGVRRYLLPVCATRPARRQWRRRQSAAVMAVAAADEEDGSDPARCLCLGTAADLRDGCVVQFGGCAHSVCATCFDQLAAHNTATWSLTCPMCRHEFARDHVVLVVDA